jgi:hypothetical protein
MIVTKTLKTEAALQIRDHAMALTVLVKRYSCRTNYYKY